MKTVETAGLSMRAAVRRQNREQRAAILARDCTDPRLSRERWLCELLYGDVKRAYDSVYEKWTAANDDTPTRPLAHVLNRLATTIGRPNLDFLSRAHGCSSRAQLQRLYEQERDHLDHLADICEDIADHPIVGEVCSEDCEECRRRGRDAG